MAGRLQGNVALVTGASRGIGKAIMDVYISEDARVSIIDKNYDDVEDILEKHGDSILMNQSDIKNPCGVKQSVENTIEKWGKIDILVNNAGIVSRNNLTSATNEEIDNVIDTNLKGMMNVTRETISHLKETSGNVINISSTTAIGGVENLSCYSASKGGISSLTRQLAVDYGNDGINVNAIAPGTVETKLNEDLRQTNPSWREQVSERIPLGRPATPEDLEGAALFLASEESRYITGQTLVVDGGRSINIK